MVRTFGVGNNPQWPAMTPAGLTVLVPSRAAPSVAPVQVDSRRRRSGLAIGWS
jgi:hypothetical protein